MDHRDDVKTYVQAVNKTNAALRDFAAGLQAVLQPMIEQMAQFVETLDPGHAARKRREQLRTRRRAQVARLLGHEGDVPDWVQRVQTQQIDSFGTGNGRGEGWVERGLPPLEARPRPAPSFTTWGHGSPR